MHDPWRPPVFRRSKQPSNRSVAARNIRVSRIENFEFRTQNGLHDYLTLVAAQDGDTFPPHVILVKPD